MRLRVSSLLIVAVALVASFARAQTPTLVKDIYPGVYPTAMPRATFDGILGVSNGRVFLNASVYDPSMGLWVTDGSAAGTRQLLDVMTGSGADVGGTFYFSVGPPWGTSLWKSDSTAAETSFVSRLGTDPLSYGGPSRLTSAGGRLYFLFDDGIHGCEPWTSDGTEAGTKILKDVAPGPAGAFSVGSNWSASLVDAGGLLFFSAGAYASPQIGLWRSDGTEAGTFQVATVTAISSPVNVNGTLYFAASDDTHGNELWKSDGTVAGTVLVRDIVPGSASSSPSNLVAHGGALYLRLGQVGPIWKSDGTEAGTVLVHSQPGSGPLVSAGGRLFSASGSQLWASDGTEAGTTLVRDFGVSFSLSTAATVPGALLLWVDRGVDGLELWRSDGTAAGTTLVKTIESGNADAGPYQSVSIPGAAVFLLGGTAAPLWRSDGTAAGTYSLLEPAFVPNDSSPGYITDVNGTILFAATDADHGRELWRSDGTPGGTVLVKDIEPGPGSSSPGQFFVTPSFVYFTAQTSATGFEVYRTDGTAAGTFLIKDVQASPNWQTVFGLVGDVLVFATDDGVHGLELWRTDGTSDGTYLLGDLTPGPASSILDFVGALNGHLYFSASDGATTTLWKTDGTAAGTASVAPIPTIYQDGAELGGALYFSATDSTHGTELWRTDGTAAGTALFRDINPSGDSSPYVVGRLGDRLVFWADDGTHGLEPWTTDGTAAGTSILGDLDPGPAKSGPGAFTFLGSTLFFFAHDGVHGFEPWKTDGTPAGTVLVRDVAPGPGGSYFMSSFSAMGHEALFTASDHVSGREYWRTDGTAAGTTQVADLVPGIAGGAPRWYTAAGRMPSIRSGGRILFVANDGTTGDELWSLPIPLGFHPSLPAVSPTRVIPAGPAGGIPLGASQTIILPVTGRCGIPSTADLRRRERHRRQPHRHRHALRLRRRPDRVGYDGGARYRRKDARPERHPTPRHDRLALRPRGPSAGKLDARPPRRERLLRMTRRQRIRRIATTERWLPMRVRVPVLLVAASITVGAGALAQAPTLVKDIYPGTAPTASAPAGFEWVGGVSGGRAFLSGWDTDLNDGVWVTDGICRRDPQVLDLPALVPGVDVNGTFYFAAAAQDGRALWKSDGTVAGTTLVRRFNPDPMVYATVRSLTKVGNSLFFTADDGIHGKELWTSDGSAAGTRLVKEITPGPTGSFDYTASFVDARRRRCSSRAAPSRPAASGEATAPRPGTYRLADVEMSGDGVDRERDRILRRRPTRRTAWSSGRATERLRVPSSSATSYRGPPARTRAASFHSEVGSASMSNRTDRRGRATGPRQVPSRFPRSRARIHSFRPGVGSSRPSARSSGRAMGPPPERRSHETSERPFRSTPRPRSRVRCCSGSTATPTVSSSGEATARRPGRRS